MSSYIEIVNNRGIININDEYCNFSLLSKYPLSSLYSGTNEHGVWWGENDFGGSTMSGGGSRTADCYEIPIDLFNDNIVVINLAPVLFNNLSAYQGTHIELTKGTDVSDVYIYIYSKNISNDSSACGLCIYNEYGENIFNSERKYLRILELSTNTLPVDKQKGLVLATQKGGLACLGTNTYFCADVFASGGVKYINPCVVVDLIGV